jgi:hypothetical protein
MNIYERIFRLLLPFITAVDQAGGWIKIKLPHFDPLCIDFLYEEKGYKVYAMAHNFVQNGDLMADPDMEIRVYPGSQQAEALTYQQDSLGLYWEVYPAPDKVRPIIKSQLNTFLLQWLKNLKAQGYLERLQAGEYETRNELIEA